MRKLASVQIVDDVRSIAGADNIEVAQVGGWQCVVKKDEFKPGDLGVYFEIDSVPPDDERYRFLWDKKNMGIARPSNYRIRTVRLRGQISQGLLKPISFFPELDWVLCTVGADVSEILGVEKYEPIIPNQGEIESHFRFECPKTDEPRLQSNMHLLEEFRGISWIATVKLDGQSMTVGIDTEGRFSVASRNWTMKEGENRYWSVIRKLGLEDRFYELGSEYIFQGELCGPGIQRNLLNLSGYEFFVFNVWSRESHSYLPYDMYGDIVDSYGLRDVPLETRGHDLPSEYDLESLLELAKGKYVGTKNHREGLVFRPAAAYLNSPTTGERLSFKVINNQYLLSEKD